MRNLIKKFVSIMVACVLMIGLLPVIDSDVNAEPITRGIRWTESDYRDMHVVSRYDYRTDVHTNIAEHNSSRGITVTSPETDDTFSWIDWEGHHLKTGATGGKVCFTASAEGEVFTEICLVWDPDENQCEIPDGWTYKANYENAFGVVDNYLVWEGTPSKTVDMDFNRTVDESELYDVGYDIWISTIYFTLSSVRDHGSCGADATWSLDYYGNLTISGSGDMSWSGDEAPWYQYRDDISTVNISDDITSIASNAFKECMYMNTCNLPASLVTIGNSAFESCYELENVTLPDTVTTIGDRAFCYCIGIEQLSFGSGLQTIGRQAFLSCEKVQSVTIPDSVTLIGYQAFMMCSALNKVTLSEGLSEIPGGCFNDCWNLTSIEIPEGVRYIGPVAFDGVPLTELVLHEGLEEIDSMAFQYNQLTTLIIPRSVTKLSDSVFEGGTNLTDVVIDRSVDITGVFSNTENITFHYYYDIEYSVVGNGTLSGDAYSYGTAANDLVITPDDGFALDTLTWTNEEGSQELTTDGNGQYIMPDSDSDVVIEAVFNCPMAEEVIAMIEDLPAPEDLTLDDKEAVDAAGEAYEALNNDQKKYVPDEYVERLKEAQDVIEKLELEKNREDALAELKDLLESKNESDYEADDWNTLTGIIDEAINSIKTAATSAEIIKIKNDAINAVNAIATKADENASEDEEEPAGNTDDEEASDDPDTVPATPDQNDDSNTDTGDNNVPSTSQYYVAAGGNGTWYLGSNTNYVLTVKMQGDNDTSFDHFTGLRIGDTTLTRDEQYSAVIGSTVITINAATLEKLGAGTYTVTVLFDDGSISTTLVIKEAADNGVASTGEAADNTILIGETLMLISIGMFAITILRKKKFANR